jgi:formylglycine-generating enzyme required for sulfatase activity
VKASIREQSEKVLVALVLIVIATTAIATVCQYSRTDPAVASTPPGMTRIPGGDFVMGARYDTNGNDICMRATYDSRPIHRVYVDGFYMDKTDVTNDEFARFVGATGYVTVAERTPRTEDFPGAPPGNLVPGSVVFTPPCNPVPLNNHFRWWSYIAGANWRHPLRSGERYQG